ncbi:MAG: Gfo/Idh/MocA family oxidoreductase [Verrucomicrobiota bacterium]|nr:Gfo/Idh/MocA family oxidoreductase [Limisphaera sp.]MDW8381172.1 Gfo/Idh/MocA family oxidoreductase [Verrucomicrobiota bacterium]
MDKVRIGIVGLGNIGRYHADYLRRGQVKRAELVAVCAPRVSPEQYPDLKCFTDARELFHSGLVDAVIIATPHYQHVPLGRTALEAGLHVLVEKPIAAHKADAERLIEASQRHPRQIFAAMFQLRTEPRYQKLRRLITSGELGEIVRVNWINTDWFRPEIYFATGGWRATWKGEGGGVLLNQCLHNLDMLQWLCGMPVRVQGFCQFGRYHEIEVEDNVTAYLEWPNRATGVFLGSTGEAPGTNRLEIAGTRGKVVLENNRLLFTRNETDMLEFSRSARQPFAKPEVWHVEIPFTDASMPHAMLVQNFVDAILDGAPLIAPGTEGIHSVELANAIVFSALLNRALELPMDGAAWEAKLQELSALSKSRKKVVQLETTDFTASFRR